HRHLALPFFPTRRSSDLTVDPAGPLCICGNRGCLETRFSGRAIESAAAAAIHRGLETDLAARPVTCGRVFEAAAGGDPVAREIRSEEHTSELQSRENLVC